MLTKPAPPPPENKGWGEGGAGRSLSGGGGGGEGEGGRGSRGEGEGVQGGRPPPLAGMNHIDQELQKCTTLTQSVYTFVIMFEHK